MMGQSYHKDPFQSPMPFNDILFKQIYENRASVKIGLVAETPFLKCSSAVKRSMAIARQALVSAGYEVVNISVPAEFYTEGRKLTIELVTNICLTHCNESFRKSGEVLEFGTWQVQFLIDAQSCPIRRFIVNTILNLTGRWRDKQIFKLLKVKNSADYTEMIRRRKELAYRVSEWWQKTGVEALVTPAFPHCAFRAEEAADMGLMLEYIFLWSVIYFPAGVVPVT